MRLRGKTRAAADEYVTMAKRSIGRRENTTNAMDCFKSLKCGPLGLAINTMSVGCGCANLMQR